MASIELNESTFRRLDSVIEAYESETGRESSYDRMISAFLNNATNRFWGIIKWQHGTIKRKQS